MRQFKNVEIILEESQAVLANSLYIIPVGNGKAKAVVTDANGSKVSIASDVTDYIATTGNDADVLMKDSAAPYGVKWSDRLTNVESATTAITSSVVDKMLHYWDATAGKWLSSGVEWISAGILKVKSIILTTNTGTALPDELGFDGVNVFFGNTKRKLRYNDSTVFTYTPTGNFTISQIRTAMEAAGYVFNDCHINVQLGSNNYTCTIDIGVSHPYRIFTMDRNGTGSISFLSTRTLNSGMDSITIMNGNEFSRAIIKTGTSVDFLKIRNE